MLLFVFVCICQLGVFGVSVSAMNPKMGICCVCQGQKASAVKRKQQAGNTGPKPSNVATIKKAGGGYIGPNISGSYDGVKLSNPSYRSYYAGRIKEFPSFKIK